MDGIEYLLWRHTLADGEVTTMYAVRYPRRSTRARVVHFPEAERLDVWCRRNGVEEAVVAGFFLRDPYFLSDRARGFTYVIHGLSGTGLVGLVIAHVYFAVRPDKWWITKAMIVGWITRRQYLEHHEPSRWQVGSAPSTAAKPAGHV